MRANGLVRLRANQCVLSVPRQSGLHPVADRIFRKTVLDHGKADRGFSVGKAATGRTCAGNGTNRFGSRCGRTDRNLTSYIAICYGNIAEAR